MENYMYLVPVAAVIALIFAAYLARKVGRQSAGTERMKEIAAAIAEGARAFLTAEYKILIVFVVVLFVLIGIGVGSWVTAICFVVGALFSTVAGYCGMTVATKANVRTANAAKESGMNKALSIAWYDPLFSFYTDHRPVFSASQCLSCHFLPCTDCTISELYFSLFF